MGFKLWVGKTIENTVDKVVEHNYRLASFIPNGRILELDLKRAGLNPKIIFDVGANDGQTARGYLKHFPNATIYCFEPVNGVYETLVAQTNNVQIKCFKVGLGEVAGGAEIHKSDTYNGAGAINADNTEVLSETEIIQIAVGDVFCKEQHISEIDLLKIDTEGYELPVLKGLASMLKKTRFIYVEAGFDPDSLRQTHISHLTTYLHANNFIVSGFYGQFRMGRNKLKLNHCDVLFTNTKLVDIL